MRILQVCPYDWHAPGGVQTHIRALSDTLRARGHQVLVATPGRVAAHEPWVRIVGRPVTVAFNGTTAPISPQPSVGWRIREVLRAFRPDLVHVHEPLAPSASAYAGLLTSAPLVATFHAHCDSWIGPWLYAVGTWPMNRRVSAGIAVSPSAIGCVSARVRVPFRIVPNGVDDTFFAIDPVRPMSSPSRILFAHRLEPRKGFRVAVAAFALAALVVPDAELVVVGDGPELRAIDALPSAIRRRVIVMGTLSRAALLEQFREATVLIAPATNGESFGVVLIEAMAAALPVVASDVPGYRGVLRGGGGILVPPADPAALAGAVTRVLQSGRLARELGDAGRRRAVAYAWPAVAAAVEEVYACATAARSRARASAAV